MLGHGALTKTSSICRYHETTKTKSEKKHEINYAIESQNFSLVHVVQEN